MTESVWKTLEYPGHKDDEEPAFCHDCQHRFDHREKVRVNLAQGRMLCVGCHDGPRVGPSGGGVKMLDGVHQEPHDPLLSILSQEKCCFCRTPTDHWYRRPDGTVTVALCEKCAKWARRQDVPSKDEWLTRENIAAHAHGKMRTAHSCARSGCWG